MRARIFQQPKTAMQSGVSGTQDWVLEWEPSARQRLDPLMGWPGSGSTQAQIRLRFDTREEAVSYAERQAITYDIELNAARVHKPKAYADNFKFGRSENWTH